MFCHCSFLGLMQIYVSLVFFAPCLDSPSALSYIHFSALPQHPRECGKAYIVIYICRKLFSFFPMARQPFGGLGRLIFRGFTITVFRHHSVGLLWTRDQLIAETSTWQHKILARERSMPLVGFEPTILVSERSQTHTLDRTASRIGIKVIPAVIFIWLVCWCLATGQAKHTHLHSYHGNLKTHGGKAHIMCEVTAETWRKGLYVHYTFVVVPIVSMKTGIMCMYARTNMAA